MGYREQAWIETHVRPEVEKLGREIKWPVKFLTLSGCDLVNRVTTDYDSPFTEYKYSTGWRVSLMWTAAGRVYLAFCDPGTQQILADRVKDFAAPSSNGRGAKTMGKDALAKMTQRIRKTGYEIRSLASMASFSIAVPVLVGERVIGALSVMMFRATVSQQDAVEKVLPLIEVAAKAIGKNLAHESHDLFDSAADEVPPVLTPTKLAQPGRARASR
jgi:IclR family transcriptional regulator, mhp operon transcriptional activator